MTYTVAIVGSRDYPKLTQVDERLARLAIEHYGPNMKVISGVTRGVDSRARVFCQSRGLDFEEFPADWSQGKGAGLARNVKLVEMADLVIAFWDGQSKGTRHTIDTALQWGKDLEVHFPPAGRDV